MAGGATAVRRALAPAWRNIIESKIGIRLPWPPSAACYCTSRRLSASRKRARILRIGAVDGAGSGRLAGFPMSCPKQSAMTRLLMQKDLAAGCDKCPKHRLVASNGLSPPEGALDQEKAVVETGDRHERARKKHVPCARVCEHPSAARQALWFHTFVISTRVKWHRCCMLACSQAQVAGPTMLGDRQPRTGISGYDALHFPFEGVQAQQSSQSPKRTNLSSRANNWGRASNRSDLAR